MNGYSQVITLFSRDAALTERLQPLLEESFLLQICGSFYEFSRLMDRNGPGVVLLDVRLPPDAPELENFPEEFPHHLFLALGNPVSTPMRQPAVSRMHRAIDIQSDPMEIVREVAQAQQMLDLQEENRRLTRELAAANLQARPDPPAAGEKNLFSVRELIRIVRCMDSVEALQEQLLEELSSAIHLSRVGLALRSFQESTYRVCAGWMLSPESRKTVFEENDAFVRWFENNPHLITRANISHVDTPAQPLMLTRVLDRLGAEVIVPLRGRHGLIGWFFCSHPLNGHPFPQSSLDQLILVADLMSVSLERAMLYREVSLQKTLAETLINALPLGIVYADADNIVRWCSPSTQTILGGDSPDKTGEPLHSLGPKIQEAANAVSQKKGQMPVIREWRDPVNGRPLRITALAIEHQQTYSGVLLTLEDRTRENAMQDRQDRLERGLFWNQLAASMSHEVRNPLVTIKTFAQLLPERYQDPEFRAEFSDLVGKEINRLGAMIDQLNDFAHPRELSLIKLDVRQALQFAWVNFQKNPPYVPIPPVTDEIEACLPDVLADLNALTQTIEHILQNAAEALENRSGTIHVTLKTGFDLECGETVEIGVTDDGAGIPVEIREHMFSPFCTQKARGLGLGLAIAQRTMADHNGKIEVLSSPRGTKVRLILPAFKMGSGT